MKNKITLSYLGLIFVILLWGISPLITLRFFDFYSPTILISYSSLVCAVILLIISHKKLKVLNKTYFIIAIPTGFFMAIANVLQKIGLLYTTPTHYAFLENLSCLVVPFLMFLFIKKKPSFLTISAALLCLISSFILTGMTTDDRSISLIGDLLCAFAGILYGINIAGTGAFATKLYAPLYLMIQMLVQGVVAFVGSVFLDITGIEKTRITLNLGLIITYTVIVFITSTLCWLIRINAMKHVAASVVAIMMPFSSVVTTFSSIIAGKDVLTLNLIIGVIIGLIAIILSGFGDKQKKTKDCV